MEGRLGTKSQPQRPNLGVTKAAEGSLDGVNEADFERRRLVNDDCLGLISSRLVGWAGTRSLLRDLCRKVVEVGCLLRLTPHVSFRNSTLLNGERDKKMWDFSLEILSLK